MSLLPEEIHLPEGDLNLLVEFGVSNKLQDIDNGLKPFVDILQKTYEFNDNRIYGLLVLKSITPKGEEFIRFAFEEYDGKVWDEMWYE